MEICNVYACMCVCDMLNHMLNHISNSRLEEMNSIFM